MCLVIPAPETERFGFRIRETNVCVIVEVQRHQGLGIVRGRAVRLERISGLEQKGNKS